MIRPAVAGLLLLAASSGQAAAHLTTAHDLSAQAVQLIAKDLKGIPGKEGTLLLVEYPPGGADPVHRHHASVFVYVLEGTIVMQVEGGEEVTLTKGQTFTEDPDDLHLVGRNASKTEPAKFLAFFVKDTGVPPVVPVP